jgi:hypothetical protein
VAGLWGKSVGFLVILVDLHGVWVHGCLGVDLDCINFYIL